MDYSNRRLTDVTLHGLQVEPSELGNTAYANVGLTFSNWSNDDNGPEIHFNLAVPCEIDDPTIADAERLILDGIAAILGRAAQETGATLHDCLRRGRQSMVENAFVKPKN